MSNRVKLTLIILLVLGLVYAFFALDIPYKKAEVIQTRDKVILDNPITEAISSPITLSGKAVGPWFFEASFPVKLLDEEGNLLAIVPAQAIGDWMVVDYVPWSVTLTFDAGSSTSGIIRLQKDNPSGDPERDEHIDVPVTFKK